MLLLYIAHSDGDYDDHDIVQNERLHRDDDHADADNSIKVKNKEEKLQCRFVTTFTSTRSVFFCQHILHYNPEEVLNLS